MYAWDTFANEKKKKKETKRNRLLKVYLLFLLLIVCLNLICFCKWCEYAYATCPQNNNMGQWCREGRLLVFHFELWTRYLSRGLIKSRELTKHIVCDQIFASLFSCPNHPAVEVWWSGEGMRSYFTAHTVWTHSLDKPHRYLRYHNQHQLGWKYSFVRTFTV